jgi:hypothetical protein
MNGKKKEPRKIRGYKAQETPYRKAIRRGEKEKFSLAQLLEQVVIHYAKGYTIAYFPTDEEMKLCSAEKITSSKP